MNQQIKQNGAGTISPSLKTVLIIFFSSYVCLSLLFYALASKLTNTVKNATEISIYSLIFVLISLGSIVFLLIYYQKKGFKAVRNSYILYLSAVVCNMIISLLFTRYQFNDWSLILLKIVLCLEMVYYLSILLSKPKKPLGLIIFAIGGLALALMRGVEYQSNNSDLAPIVAIGGVLIYVALVYAFYEEIPQEINATTTIKDDLLDD